MIRWLNKTALIESQNDIELNGGCENPWKLCSIQQVETIKRSIHVTLVCALSIVNFTAIYCLVGNSNIVVAQALKMDRQLTSHFKISIASISVVTLVVTWIFLLMYDHFIVPTLSNLSYKISLLRRIGLGNISLILATIIVGFVERHRRASHGVAPISVMWLFPQLNLLGIFQVLTVLGFMKFFNIQFPKHMRSIGNSFVSLSTSLSAYLTEGLLNLIHHFIGEAGWLNIDINAGKLDYVYFLQAVLLFLNFLYFLYDAWRFQYKPIRLVNVEQEADDVDEEARART